MEDRIVDHDGVCEWSDCRDCGAHIDWASDQYRDAEDDVCPECGSSDLGMRLPSISGDKRRVKCWSTETSYVQTFPNGDHDGACDVEVQIGKDLESGKWYLRTQDDAGGSDECDDTSYESAADARSAANEFAWDNNEAKTGEDAEDYLRRMTEERAGVPSDSGEYCVYWNTALEDSGPRERYETQEQAEAACDIANEDLHSSHPGQLLCGFSVRHLVDGEWVQAEKD